MVATIAAITFGSWLLDKIKDKGFDTLYSKLTETNEINIKFVKAIEEVSKKTQKKHPDVLGGKIEYFFKSETVFKELMKLIFINSKVNIQTISTSFDTETLPKEFILDFVNSLKEELLKDRDLNAIIADKELFILIYGIGNDVEKIAENSTLTLNEIKELKKIIEERIGQKFLFDIFFKTYRENTINNLSQVNFIGLGVDISIKRKRKNLQDVFVKPNFRLLKNDFFKMNNLEENHSEDEEDDLNYRLLFNHSNKIVILGNPGSGKSILVKSIICNILERKKNEFDNKEIEECIPFRIELRKYLAYKKQNRGNILKYLNSLLEEEYGVFNLTELILDRILKENKNIIFFDGLDEIFKIEDKIEVKNDIENFHSSYLLTKSLTTSRIIGYDEAKLNESEFCELNILNFNNEQIHEYLQNWYRKEEENQEIREKEINGFLSKMHEIDDELVSNPLLLSLIVIIYRNTLKLPESKLEIYQSCTKTLVEKWDASKGLEINLDPLIYRNKEKIFADLAYWQYEQLSGEKISITFDKALKTVSNTLEDKLKIDNNDSFTLSESFMEYAQKRSIYFDNNFTHKTFLEYYTAYWIYSNVEKKHKIKERNTLISKYIDNPFWHIVLELLLNMIDKDQADSEIMDDLINLQIDNNSKSLPFILSTINSFKNVSIQCLTTSINVSIDFIIKNHLSTDFNRKMETLQYKIYENIKELYYSEAEVKNIIIKKLISNESENLTILDLNYSLYLELYAFNFFREDITPFKFELDNETLFQERINKNPYLYILDAIIINYNNYEYLSSTIKFMNFFGADEMFKECHSQFDRVGFSSFFMAYLRNQTQLANIETIAINLETLIRLGLNEKKLVNQLIDKDLYYIDLEEKVLKKLIDIFDSEDKNIICIMLLIIIFKNSKDYGRITSNTFKKLFENKKKTNILMNLQNIKTQNRIEEIFKIYDYKIN